MESAGRLLEQYGLKGEGVRRPRWGLCVVLVDKLIFVRSCVFCFGSCVDRDSDSLC
jgi:hypothetical protein